MVVIFLPATVDTGVTQERVAAPSTCTVQAPHWAMPQPNLVPVIHRLSRRTQSSGVSAGTSTRRVLPLIVRVIMRDSFRGQGLRGQPVTPGQWHALFYLLWYKAQRNARMRKTRSSAVI